MPTSSADQTLLELPPHLQIIQDQIKSMDKNVLTLHALLDLLDRPDDQRGSLGEMLSTLLKELSDRQAQYQVELMELISQMKETREQIKDASEKTHKNQRTQDQKLDRILSILGQQLD